MKIIVDAMGGDNAPQAPIEGALRAQKDLGVEILLTGRTEDITACLAKLGHEAPPQGMEIVPASQVIDMEDNPARAFKEKPDSSMTVGLNLLKAGQGDAFVSAGSTGALLSAATLMVKRIRGIRRAALAPVVPNATGNMVLIDCGATAECTPEYLLQFAFMGSYYAQRFLGIQNPRVGLLNIGAEDSKGTDLQKQTLALLRKAGEEGHLNFIGNIEAKEAIKGGCDVIVTDGFSGNILLKTMEGVGSFAGHALGDIFRKNLLTKLAAAMVMPGLRAFKAQLDPNKVGGTAFIGISRPVIKAHGSSNAEAIENAVGQAIQVAESGITEAIAAHMRATGVDCTASQVLVTSGALQALQMISVSLLPAGTTVYAESPSYIKSLQVFQSAGMHLEGVPMDDDGLNVQALRGLLAEGELDTGRPAPLNARNRKGNAILYTIPTNHNPTGVTMSDKRRHELVELSVDSRLPIIEDGAYRDLYFEDDAPLPSLKALDETGMVITLGSASKSLAPGLRIGWLVAAEPIVQRLADVKMQMDYGASVLSQWTFARFLTNGMYDEYVAGLKRELRHRRDRALVTLQEKMDGLAHWNVPSGGFYIWMTFDRPIRMNRLFQLAAERGVLLNPGDIYDFAADNSLRLSYSYTTPEEFADAVDVLAAVARELA